MSGIQVGLVVDGNIDDAMLDQFDELQFIFSYEFMSWFLGIEITQYLQQRATTRFQREGKQAGEQAWKPLAESTREDRRAQGFGGAHPINKRTGEMEEWVTQSNSRVTGVAGDMELQWPADMPSGELLEKVTTAQMGRKTKDSYVPRRPVIRFSEVDFVHLMSRLAMHMEPAGVKFHGN